MEKNVLILDDNGIKIGHTYPKRAKGLIKNGRAEYVDDWTIRLLHTDASTTIDFNSEGDNTMSNVICFNARDFKLDKSYDTNVASRMFITDMFGDSVEVYELGDGSDATTQIHTVKELELNTDYVIRFAVTASKEYADGVTQFMIVPIQGEEETPDDWENRFIYNLSQNQYKSVVSKSWGSDVVRVYEIPLNTVDIHKFRFVFMNKKTVARIYPAHEISDYDKFQDFSYSSWLNEKKEQFEQFSQDFDWEKNVKDAGEAAKRATKKATETVTEALDSIWNSLRNSRANYRDFNPREEVPVIVHSNEEIDSASLKEILNSITGSAKINFNDSNFTDTEDTVNVTQVCDGIKVTATNASIDGRAFASILMKAGDESRLDFSNSSISGIDEKAEIKIEARDMIKISLANAEISASSFANLMKLVGDISKVNLENTVIDDDGSELDFGKKADRITLNAKYATIPNSVWVGLHKKLGDGCNITDI